MTWSPTWPTGTLTAAGEDAGPGAVAAVATMPASRQTTMPVQSTGFIPMGLSTSPWPTRVRVAYGHIGKDVSVSRPPPGGRSGASRVHMVWVPGVGRLGEGSAGAKVLRLAITDPPRRT